MRPPAHRGLCLRPGGNAEFKGQSPELGSGTRRRPIGQGYAAAEDSASHMPADRLFPVKKMQFQITLVINLTVLMT